MGEQYIGILVNASLYHGIPSGNTKHEMLSFYETAGLSQGLVPCYFRLQDLRLQHNRVEAYVRSNAGYIKKTLAIPAVIHNRAIHSTMAAKRRMKQLVQSGSHVFNSCNRYSKLYIHSLLAENPSLCPHLPGTVAGTFANLQTMMAAYSSLIIKPDNSSVGQGIMKLARSGAGWTLSARIHHTWQDIYFAHTPTLLKQVLSKRKYIIQQRLPLATFHERPFDLRVSVQRGLSGQWQVTGIAAKVAAKNRFLTNVAQGGAVYKLEEVLHAYPALDSSQVREQIEQFCLQAATYLGQRLLNLADVGFDIGITEHGFPMFIECNGRDLRYSFQKGNMPDEWRATYANPVGYARYLLQHHSSSLIPATR